MATTTDTTRKPLGILANDGKNYLARETRVKIAARKEGVDRHFLHTNDGGPARPANAGAPQTKWDQDDGKAMAEILRMLDDNGVARITDLTTAADMWSFLQKKHRHTGEAEMMAARTTLGNTRFKYNGKLTDLIDTINDLFAISTGVALFYPKKQCSQRSRRPLA